MQRKIRLNQSWVIGEQIGHGGFGRVFVVEAEDGSEAVAKMVPKEPGASRELLFVSLEDVRNVVPVIDTGEDGSNWVLVMPRAERSLRDHINASEGRLALDDALTVLVDIADALSDLDGKVVHRDLKPENVLLLEGRWCLADFGIARYAEASTAPDTRKHAFSAPYAAPERWRFEHATIAADVYAFGIIGFEMLAGNLPFDASTSDDFREAHLHNQPAVLTGVPSSLASLIEECLYKAPGARPTPADLRARLDRSLRRTSSAAGLSRLENANLAEVRRLADSDRLASEARTTNERRAELLTIANRQFAELSGRLRDDLKNAAPSGECLNRRAGGWDFGLGPATLTLAMASGTVSWGGGSAPAFDVVAAASLTLKIPPDRSGYAGRSHSLWFGDIQQAGRFGWFETAFMIHPLIPRLNPVDPFSLDPGENAAKAVGNGMAEYQVAWPFTRLHMDDLDEFIDRWAGWLSQAAFGRLGRPGQMPERPAAGSWRKGR